MLKYGKVVYKKCICTIYTCLTGKCQVGKWASGQVGKWARGKEGKLAAGKVGKWASGIWHFVFLREIFCRNFKIKKLFETTEHLALYVYATCITITNDVMSSHYGMPQSSPYPH